MGEFSHVTLDANSYTADIAISDVISSLKHIVGLEILTGAALGAGDVDNNGEVAIADVISQLKHIVGLDTLTTFDLVIQLTRSTNYVRNNRSGSFSMEMSTSQ